MADVLRIKRRVSGSPGAPASLANAEIAYSEVDHILYYGEGTGGAGGTASVIVGIAGQGLASTATPQALTAAGATGVASQWSRGDHAHPATAPTVTPSTDSTTKIATTAFVQSAITANAGVSSVTAGTGLTGGGTGAVTLSVASAGITNALLATMPTLTIKGNPTGATAAPTDMTVATTMTLLGAAPLNSPAFTGTPTTTVPANGTNTAQIASTSFVMGTRLDQFAAPTASVNLNNNKIIGLADPTNPQDAATKSYADSVAQGLDAKQSVKAASTANLTLSGTQTIDGIAVVAGDRVLVKDQTTQSANGIYLVAAAAWTRATDADTWIELVSAFTFVEQGTNNADTGWLCTVDQGGTLGTTNVTWVQFSSAGTITAGNGLTKVGNTLSVVGTANRITVGASVDIAANYVGQSTINTLGSVTTGVWNGSVIGVAYGGTGVATLTGYVKGNGTSAFTASATIPNTDISGLGTMSTQNATAVAITGGTIDNVVFDMGTF